MDEKVTVSLPDIYKVLAFRYADLDDYLNQVYGTDGKITNKEKRKAKKYWMSDLRMADYDNHNASEKNKFYQSMAAFVNAAYQRLSQNPTVTSHLQANNAGPQIVNNGNVSDNGDISSTVTNDNKANASSTAITDNNLSNTDVSQIGSNENDDLSVSLTPNWLKIATLYGFNNLDEVKAFLKKVGLEETGLLNEESLAKLAWYNHMKNLRYTEGSDLNGRSWFNHGTNTYYNNGKVKLGNGSFSDYDYKTLSNNIDYSTSNWRPHDYFRFHLNGTRQVTLPDGTFPVYVVKSNTVGKNNKWNLVEDESYAYDPATGKVRRLLENMFGMVKDEGDLKTPKWVEGEDWIDISTLPMRRFGGLLLTHNLLFNKQGGTMNRIKYFQQGGPAQQLGDVQQQVIALVQAAMQGDEKANLTVNQIMEAAKAGDQQAVQLAQMIQTIVQQMQGQAVSAKWGSKLSYIRSLKYAQGGKACPACEKGAPIKIEEKACGGKTKKAKKRYFGGWL